MDAAILPCLAGIIVAGAVAQWVAWRLRLPAILLLLGSGLLAGPTLHLLQPDQLFGSLLLPLVSLSVAVIVFEGALGLRFRELKGVRFALLRLLTLGTIITVTGVALASHYVLGFSWPLAIVLGTVLSVTGPTVIGPLLRDIRLSGRAATLLHWEAIVVDPMGAIMAAMAVSIARSESRSVSLSHMALEVLTIIVIGGFLGLCGAFILVAVMRRYWAPDRLHNPLTLAFVVGLFAGGNQLGDDAGLIAVTVMGIALANQRFVVVKHLVEFQETLVFIALSGLFVVLGARIQPPDVLDLGVYGLAFIVLLVLLRPVAVWVSTLGTGLTSAERTFVSFMAPRGVVAVAIASVFTIELTHMAVPNSERLLSATVLTVIGTVLLYGLTARWLARRLQLVDPNPQGLLFVGASVWVRRVAKTLSDLGQVVTLVDTDPLNVEASQMLGLDAINDSILSEQLIEELDTSRLRRIIAVTANAELNALACQRFTELFGREEVYHLSAGPDSGRLITVAPEQRGRELLTPEWTYQRITMHFADSGTAQSTELTSELGWTEWLQQYGEVALPLFVIRKDRSIAPCVGANLKAQVGDVIIALHSSKPLPPPAPRE